MFYCGRILLIFLVLVSHPAFAVTRSAAAVAEICEAHLLPEHRNSLVSLGQFIPVVLAERWNPTIIQLADARVHPVHDRANDVYFTGKGDQRYPYFENAFNSQLKPPKYHFEMPEVIEVPDLGNIIIEPELHLPEQLRLAYIDGYPEPLETKFFKFARGGFFQTYIHYKSQPDPMLIDTPFSHKEYIQWARENAQVLIKLPHSDLTDRLGPDMRRSRAMVYLLKRLVKAFTHDGKHILHVAEDLTSPEDAIRANRRQTFFRGETLYKIQNYINIFTGAQFARIRDKKIVQRALKELNLIDRIDEFQEKIWSIEQFARDIHYPLVRFHHVNQMGLISNLKRGWDLVKKEDAASGPVGWDYNHGSNVIYLPDTEDFVIVDE